MTRREIDRVESLLRERSAEMQRAPHRHRHPDLEPRDYPADRPVDASGVFDAPLRRAKCVECGGAIPPGRLRAVPGTARCVSCQREFETRIA